MGRKERERFIWDSRDLDLKSSSSKISKKEIFIGRSNWVQKVEKLVVAIISWYVSQYVLTKLFDETHLDTLPKLVIRIFA